MTHVGLGLKSKTEGQEKVQICVTSFMNDPRLSWFCMRPIKKQVTVSGPSLQEDFKELGLEEPYLTPRNMISGVPQEGILSPIIIFTIYGADLEKWVSTSEICNYHLRQQRKANLSK